MNSEDSYPLKETDFCHDEKERKHFKRIIRAFKYYKTFSLLRIKRTEQYLLSLPLAHQQLLGKYRNRLQEIKKCIAVNDELIQLIIKDANYLFENVFYDEDCTDDIINIKTILTDQEKVQATIKQFFRDWSMEGKDERKDCYEQIVEEIMIQFPLENFDPSTVRILIPGSGLGRLAFDVASKGYVCQGNELSLFMLIASNFVLNRCQEINSYKIHPWIHQHMNNLRSSDQIKTVYFPDVNPRNLKYNTKFSMVAGDFLEVYTKCCEWHCVATCFFIDCANNIINFIENIFKILMPDGIWINFGPLLYHYSDMPMEDSIEPSYSELRKIIQQVGFEIKKENLNVKSCYTQNFNSMLQCQYNSVYFVCQKPHINNK